MRLSMPLTCFLSNVKKLFFRLTLRPKDGLENFVSGGTNQKSDFRWSWKPRTDISWLKNPATPCIPANLIALWDACPSSRTCLVLSCLGMVTLTVCPLLGRPALALHLNPRWLVYLLNYSPRLSRAITFARDLSLSSLTRKCTRLCLLSFQPTLYTPLQ